MIRLHTRLAALLLLPAISIWSQRTLYPPAKQGGNYMHNFYLPPAPSSTPWAPCWSPDGKWLAVSMLGSIWKVNVASGEAEELTFSRALWSGRPSYHSSPTWSPDGKWIVYTADEENSRVELEVVNAETGESAALTAGNTVYADPAFSPDGSRLAYVSTEPSGYFNIYVREIRDGAWAGPEIALTRNNQYPRDRLYFGPWDMHIEPAWTPDGKELLFLSNRGVPLGSGNIWRMPAVQDGIRDARTVLSEQSLYRARPDVSPDGKRFLYSSSGGAADTFHHIYTLPVGGGAPYKMTFGDHDDFDPAFSPDGETIAYISNEGGLPRLMLLETYGGAKRRIDPKPVKWKRAMGQVAIETADESGKPVPARIQYLASDGKFYPPTDAYSRIGGYGEHFFHTAGRSVITVPPGAMEITAIRGFEHWPAKASVTAEAGRTVTARLVLKPLGDGRRASGWHNGSTHVHMNYGGNLRNTPKNVIFMSKAEDQDILNVLVANKDNRILDWQYFEKGGGEHSASKEDPSIAMLVGEEYRPPFYGHVYYLGLKDHLISPFTTGYEGTGIESLYPSNTDMFRKARAEGAVTGYVHPHSGENDPLDQKLGVGKGFPVDLALGVIDGYEWSAATQAQLQVWHRALNNDFPVAPTGGEDSISSLHATKAVGSVRTYAFLEGGLSIPNWLDSVRKGHTFFTSGPLLELTIDGKLPGETIRLPESGGSVHIKARVWSWAPLAKAVLHHNGRVFRDLPLARPDPAKGGLVAELDEQVPINGSGWFSLAADGVYTPLLDVNYPQAATNAIRVYTGSQLIRNKPDAEYFVQWIDKLSAMAGEWPWWRSDKERSHVLGQFTHARQIFEQRAAQARPE